MCNSTKGDIRLEINDQSSNYSERCDPYQIKLELIVLKDPTELALKGKVTQDKVRTGQEHKDYDNILYQRGVVPISNTGILCRKSTCTQCTERMVYRIKYRHSGNRQQDSLGQGVSNVNKPKTFGRIGYPRMQFISSRPGSLRSKELHPSNS